MAAQQRKAGALSFQAYLDKTEEETGLTPREMVGRAHERGFGPGTRSGEILAWLAADLGLGRGHGMALVHVIKNGPEISDRHVGSSGSHRDASTMLRLDGVAARSSEDWAVSLPRPYPADTYVAEEGEVSAWLRRTDDPADITYRHGGTCEYLATGDQAAGRFGLYRWTFGETESGPDPHFHRSIWEQFYVLSGEVRLYDGRRWITARPGDFLYVPEGGVHGFRGAGRASMLLLMFTPRRSPRGLLRNLGPGRADD